MTRAARNTRSSIFDASEQTGPHFWYSRRTARALLASLFVLTLAVSTLIPPFQSPDEFYHLQRAYLLAKGEVILGKKNGVTGGEFDTGLLDYMKNFQNVRWFAYNLQYLQAERSPYVCLGTSIQWSGRTQFERVPNTAVYFPMSYAPHALAFFIGEHAGLTISQTYYLTRVFALAAVLAVLWCALVVYPMPLFVMALFVTPMTLLQLGSPTLDALSFALCTLTAALLCRGCDARLPFGTGLHAALLLCLLALATSRLNLIPLTLLLAAVGTVRRSRIYLASAAVVLALCLTWILFAQANINAGNGHDPAISRAIVYYYVTHVAALLRVLCATITNLDLLQAYWYTFVGVVGWAGFEVFGSTPTWWHGIFLDSSVYIAWGVLLPALALATLRRAKCWLPGNASLWLVGGTLAAFLLLLLLQLPTWSPHPAQFVVGLQGRYFTPLLIFAGFALFGGRGSPQAVKAGLVLVFAVAALSTVSLTKAMLNSYWVMTPAAAANAPQSPRTDCGQSLPVFWFDLPSADPCKRAGLPIYAPLKTPEGGVLCAANRQKH